MGNGGEMNMGETCSKRRQEARFKPIPSLPSNDHD
jgi:hypothetical protein